MIKVLGRWLTGGGGREGVGLEQASARREYSYRPYRPMSSTKFYVLELNRGHVLGTWAIEKIDSHILFNVHSSV